MPRNWSAGQGGGFSSTRIYNYPNVAALARWLSNPLPEAKAPAASRQTSVAVASADPDRLLDDVRQMTEEEMQAFIMKEMAKQ